MPGRSGHKHKQKVASHKSSQETQGVWGGARNFPTEGLELPTGGLK